MSDFINLQLEGLDEILDLIGSPFIYNGTTYTGIISALKTESKLRDGGFLDDIDTIIIARVGDFAKAPLAGEKFTVSGKTVRIDSVATDETAFEFRCVTAAK